MRSSQLRQLRAAAAVSSSAVQGPGGAQGSRAEHSWVHHCTHPGEGIHLVGGTRPVHSLGVAVHTARHTHPGVRKAAHTVTDRTEAARRPGLVAGTDHTAVTCWGPEGDSLLPEAGSHPVAVDSHLVLVDNLCCRSRTLGSLVVVLPCWLCQ